MTHQDYCLVRCVPTETQTGNPNSMTNYKTKQVGECGRDDSYRTDCPFLGYSWNPWSTCTVSCGGGTRTRTRPCHCQYNNALCSDISHPTLDGKTDKDLCPPGTKVNGRDEGVRVETGECNLIPCGGTGEASGDGVGPGCFSDADHMSPTEFKCYDTTDSYKGDAVPEKDIRTDKGFVPHNFACMKITKWENWATQVYPTCDKYSQVDDSTFGKDSVALCNCNAGVCGWEAKEGFVERSDCTRGYEWIKMPIPSDSPFHGKIVDFITGKSATATHAIVVESTCGTACGSIYNPIPADSAQRRAISPVEADNDGSFNGNDSKEEWAMIGTCEEGDLEWEEGPYQCDNKCGETGSWSSKEYGCLYDQQGGFSCSGSPRDHPFYDKRKKFSSAETNWASDAILLGLCRYKDEENGIGEDKWVLGDLIMFEWWNKYISAQNKWHTSYAWSTKTAEKVQCCPTNGGVDSPGCMPIQNPKHLDTNGELR